MIRRALVVLALLAGAGCVRRVVLGPAPDAGDPDTNGSDGDVPPDADPFDGNGTLPDAAVAD